MKETSCNFFLNIAGFTIEIRLERTEKTLEFLKVKKFIYTFYKGFLIHSDDNRFLTPHYRIVISYDKNPNFLYKFKNKEKFVHLYQIESGNILRTYYYISLSQFNFILMDVLQNLFTSKNCFMLHGSAALVSDGAYVFLGKEGAGKSTIVKFLHAQFPALADDSFIIKFEQNYYYLYQSPFIDKEYWIKKGHGRYLLKKVFFLKKSTNFSVKRVYDRAVILDKLLNQFYFGWMDKDYLNKQLLILTNFCSNFNNFNILYFAKNKIKIINLINQTTSKN